MIARHSIVMVLLLVGCDNKGGTDGSSPAGGSSSSNGNITVAGTLAVDAAERSTVGSDFEVANRDVSLVDETGKTVGSAITGTDGSYAVSIPGQLAVGDSSPTLHLVDRGLKVEAVAADTLDGSVVGVQTPVNLGGQAYVNLGTQPLRKITAIRGRAQLDGARDHTGVSIYVPGTSYAARTDSSGQFLLTFIPAGTYQLVLEKDGYEPRAISDVVVAEDETTRIEDQVLRLGGGATNFSVKQIGNEGFSQSRVVEFLISPGEADRFRGGLEADIANIPYGKVPDLFRYEFPSDGTFTVQMIFANADGFESTVSRTIVVDTVRPSSAGLSLADLDTLSKTHTNITQVIPWHQSCSDIYRVAIVPSGELAPREQDFVWPCRSVIAEEGAHFQIPGDVSTFTYEIWAMDRVGNISETGAAGSITLDRTPPPPPQFLVKDQTSGSEEGTDITTVFVSFQSCADTKKVLFSESQTSQPNASQFIHDCSITDQAYTYTFSSNAPGTKTVTAWAMDHAGNIGIVSSSKSIVLDQIPPVAPSFILSDPTEATAGYSNTRSVDAMVANCTGITHILVSETQITKPLEGASAWTPCSDSIPISVSFSADGLRTARLWARDVGGNVSDAATTATITVDTVAPVVTGYAFSIADSTSGSTSFTNSTTITLSFGACNSDSKWVYFTESATPPSAEVFTELCGSGTYSANFVFGSSVEGAKTVRAWIKDISGTVSLASSTRSITLDTTSPTLPPSFSLSSQETAVAGFTNSNNVDFTVGTCSSENFILIAEGQTSPPAEGSSAWQSCATSGSLTGAVSAGEGQKTFYLWLKDPAGNIAGNASDEPKFVLTRDMTPPAPPTISAPSDPLYTQSTGVSTNGTTEAFAMVTITGATQPVEITADGAGNWTGTVTLGSNSYHYLAYVAKDRAGNLSSGSYLTAVHDTIAPTITIPSPNVEVRHDSATISWSTGESTNSLFEWGTTTSYGSQSTASGYSQSVTLSGLAQGQSYYYKISATDLAGNHASANDYAGSFKTATQKTGTIASNQQWTVAGSPYLVTGNIQVSSGVTLTIDPGVTVRFDSGKQLWVDGELVARGTTGSRVVFEPQNASAVQGYWNSIHFSTSSTDTVLDGNGDYVDGNIIEYANIKGGGSTESMITIVAAKVALFNVDVQKSGLSAYGYSAYQNTDAVNADPNSELYIRDSNFYNTFGNAVVFNTSASGTGVLEVKRTTFSQIGQTPVYFGRAIASGTVTVEDCNFSSFKPNWMGSGRGAIFAETSGGTPLPNINIRRNFVDARGSGYDTKGISVIGGSGKTVNIEDNVVYGAGYFGIELTTQGTTTINVNRNIVAEGGWAGIRLMSGGSGGTINIDGNVIVGNGAFNDSTAISDQLSHTGAVNILRNAFIRNDYGGSTVGLLSIKNDANKPTFVLTDNSFADNFTPYAIRTARASPTVNAQSNYWGTVVASQIDDVIYDSADDFSKADIDTANYLSLPNSQAPLLPPRNLAVNAPAAGVVTLTWDAGVESDIVGYRVYYDIDSAWPYSGTGASEGNSGVSAGGLTTLTLTGLPTGSYVFTVTAVDAGADGIRDQNDGSESWYSSPAWLYVP